MKIVITGATGFIGTALCEEMLVNSHEVVAVVRPGSKKKEKLSFPGEGNRLEIVEAGLDEMESLAEQVGQADVFYHLAWNGSAGTEREDFDIQNSNIGYTADAIRAAVKCGCRKFVGAGSQAEYGVVHGLAKEEETIPRPFMMYGAAKLAAYQMGQILAKQLGIRLVWPRIYSVYGVGENPGTLVSYVMETLRKGEVPELSPCENMWNFMYITDCARALRMLGEKEEAAGIYHVASEDTRLLKEFVEEIRDVVAPGSELRFGARVSDLAKTFWLEPAVKQIEALGFSCKIKFRQGIEKKRNRL
jgi:UDP-glucose 4-epimerase|nr:NAD(P)-dependent oxidoreductase [uncultured Acetatifactor sp.]